MDDQSKPDPDDAAENDGAAESEAPPKTEPAASDEPSPAALPDDSDATELVTPDPDATKLIRPGGAATQDAATQGDATQGDARQDAATQVVPPRGAPSGSGDATTILRPQAPDPTSIMPQSTTRPAERWSGKANVPPGRPPRDPDATSQWQPPEPSRAWWLPILLAIVGLVLLIGIAFAVVTALNNNSSDTPAPTPPATPTTPSQVPSSTISSAPTSVPPTTPTPGGTFTVPSSLIGLPINDAESILDSYGIAYTAVAQPNDSALPNTVINTSPAAGQAVPNGGAVTLYYAQPTAPSTPSTPSTATTPTGSATPTS